MYPLYNSSTAIHIPNIHENLCEPRIVAVGVRVLVCIEYVIEYVAENIDSLTWTTYFQYLKYLFGQLNSKNVEHDMCNYRNTFLISLNIRVKCGGVTD